MVLSVASPNFPGYSHLHLPSRVRFVEPFGKWTKVILYHIHIYVAQPYGGPESATVEDNFCESRRSYAGKEIFYGGAYRDLQRLEGSAW